MLPLASKPSCNKTRNADSFELSQISNHTSALSAPGWQGALLWNHATITTKSFSPLKKPLIIIFVILLLDQILKIYIKTTMTLGQEFHVAGDWFIVHFTENPGMAFGLSFGGEWGKLVLSLFRLGAIAAIGWYLCTLVQKKANTLLLISIALIFAGATGNMIDSAFYGMIFSQSTFHSVAQFLPEGGGYSSFLHGRVVDMFYFPLIEGHYPQWVPMLGGDEFVFFRPVFNLADSAITIGVLMLILFQRSFFASGKKEKDAGEMEETSSSAAM
jgi:signal peptidase II